MKGKENSGYIIGRLKGIVFAFKGAFKLIATEPSIQVQSLIAIILTCAGFYFNITKTEWLFQTLAIGLVLSIEGINTAIEKTADFIHPDYHERIGFIKDISAGAVLFSALTAIIIGCIIYLPLILV